MASKNSKAKKKKALFTNGIKRLTVVFSGKDRQGVHGSKKEHVEEVVGHQGDH